MPLDSGSSCSCQSVLQDTNKILVSNEKGRAVLADDLTRHWQINHYSSNPLLVHHAMADAASMQTLPPEIRKEIYKYLLVEPKKIGIYRHSLAAHNTVARMDCRRNTKHRREVYDRHAKKWVPATPPTASLLLVSRQISQEARQVFYGFNHFEFEHAAALESFLDHTGGAIHHLRHISMIGFGTLFRGSWASMDRCLVRLAKAKALRTLELSHLAFCYQYDFAKLVNVKSLAEHCKPLLQALQIAYDKKNLNVSAFDVIKITLPPCGVVEAHGNPLTDHWERDHVKTSLRGINITERLLKHCSETKMLCCSCRCDEAEDKNERLMQELKKEIAGQLGPTTTTVK